MKNSTLFFTKFLLLMVWTSSVHLATAQQDLFVSGQVVDSTSKKPLEYCTVRFANEKEELITGGVTDERGYFEAALPRGKYHIIIDFLGYKKFETETQIYQSNQYLGTFRLAADDIRLKEATVKGSAKSYQLDKNVYVVTKKMKAGTANTNDLLDKINGVTYDRYNNNIKVDGQTNIKLLVNGLEKDQDYIRALNPERIKKIEIIKDPGGKYGLEGYAAVINILLRLDYKGSELSLFDQLITDPDPKELAYFFPINNGSIEYTYTQNKLNMYGRYGHNINRFSFPTFSSTYYTDGKKIFKNAYGLHGNNQTTLATTDAITIGADYYLNPRHTISFEARLDNPFFGHKEETKKYLFQQYMDSTLEAHYFITEKNTSTFNSNYQSAFYIGRLSDEDRLEITAIRSHYSDENVFDFLKGALLEREDHLVNTQNRYKADATLTHQINDKSSLSAGYGYVWLSNQNQFNQEDFNYTDQRHRLFGYYSLKPNATWGIKAGIAAELSRPKAYDQQLNYVIYQPYLDLKYTPSNNVNMKLKYRADNQYPGLSQVNPHEIYLDNQSVSIGNPNLKPALTHKISLRTNILNGFLSIEPYYHYSNNYIGQVASRRADGIIQYDYKNIGQYQHYGIKGSIAFPVYKTLYWQTNADYYHSSITYEGHRNALSDISLESNLIYVNQPHALTTGLILQRGMNKIIDPSGYHIWNNDFLGVLLQKGFHNNRLNLMALYMLPVNAGLKYHEQDYVETPTFRRLDIYDISLIKNVIVFKLNYRLTRGKSTRTIKKDIELEENNQSKGIF